MDYTNVNFLAILVCGIIAMVIGGLWYSPVLFAKQWMTWSGINQESLAAGKNKMMAAYLINFISSLVMFYVLAQMIKFTDATSAFQGIMTGFWLSLGFIATTHIGAVLWEQKPWKLWLLHNAYYLLILVIGGAILAIWN